jgi:hypothetical protein
MSDSVEIVLLARDGTVFCRVPLPSRPYARPEIVLCDDRAFVAQDAPDIAGPALTYREVTCWRLPGNEI